MENCHLLCTMWWNLCRCHIHLKGNWDSVGYMDLCYSEALWTSKRQFPALSHKERLCVGRTVRPEEKADSFLQMLLAGVEDWPSHMIHGVLCGEDWRTKHGRHMFVNVQSYKNHAVWPHKILWSTCSSFDCEVFPNTFHILKASSCFSNTLLRQVTYSESYNICFRNKWHFTICILPFIVN